MSMFINRDSELNKLLSIAESGRAELLLMYGRRRVGKSRILTKFANKNKCFILIGRHTKNILEILSNQIKDEFVRFNTWEDFF